MKQAQSGGDVVGAEVAKWAPVKAENWSVPGNWCRRAGLDRQSGGDGAGKWWH